MVIFANVATLHLILAGTYILITTFVPNRRDMSRVVALLYVMLVTSVAMAQQIDVDNKMREYGLVDIRSLESSILVELKYSTEDNFVGKDMYGELEVAYLEERFARRVVEAQRILKSQYPQYTLLIYDAARPLSVQRQMRRCVEGTELESFVADGTRGGRHNYGVAVDLTIATADGTTLDMGTPFDDLTTASSVKGTPDSSDISTRTMEVYRSYLDSLVTQGLITITAAKNRLLLIEVMHKVGLVPYRREWWHFEEVISMTDTRNKYKLLDF